MFESTRRAITARPRPAACGANPALPDGSAVTRLPPVARFLAAQLLAFATLAAVARIPAVQAAVAGWGWVAVDAVLAVLATAAVRLSWWWLPLALALPFAVASAAGAAIPWWIWAAAFGLLVLVYGGGVATRVPLYLSNRAAVAALADLLPAKAGVRACDLGAGLGGPLTGLARRRPDAQVTGVEASPLPWLACRLRCLRRRNAQAVFGDIFAHPLADYDLVYAFLSPEPMPRLWGKVQAEMHPGTHFVSNTFAVPGIEPERVIELPGRKDARLLVYRLPGTP